MKKRSVIIVLVLILLIVAGSLCFYLKMKDDKETLLSAEFAYTNIYVDTKALLDKINEQHYSTSDEAYFKTNFILGQIDLKALKKNVEKCLLDNGISYERVEEKELIKKCGKPFIEQIFKLAKESPLDEDKLIEAIIGENLAQLPLNAYDMMTELGFSEAAAAMAPIIAYTRVDVYGCIKNAKKCMSDNEAGGSKATVGECLKTCYLDYTTSFGNVLIDYEFNHIK